ncbi:SDR family NAD(P)-dependent oxidoreductase [Cystobacter fuscus]
MGASQVLAKLSLPQAVEDTLDQFVLHPSLLDAALQASIGLLRTTDDPYLPYAMEELEILGPCTSTMWAWIRRNGKSDSAAQNEKLDIDLCDAQGNVSVRIKAFSTRPLKRSPQELSRSRSASASSLGRPVLMKPSWEAVLPQVRSPQRTSSGRTLLVGDDPAALGSVLKAETGVETLLLRANDTIDALKARLARDGATYDRVIWIAGDGRPVRPDSDSLIRKQEEGVYAGFRLAKALLALGYERRTLEWTVVTVQSQFIDSSDRVEPTHAGVHGLMGSLAKEAPLWRVRLIDVEDLQEEALQEALSLPPEPSGSVWGHRNGRWYKQTLVPIHADSGEHEHGTLYRHGGVYVIIGGAGGLGVAWTEHMVRRYQAQVVWIGRRPKDESIQTKIDELALVGPAPWYLQADASEQESLAAAVREIKTRFPKIHGVVHSAIALLDQSVARMTEERFKAAVRAKVDVSVRMAQVFQNEPLDFVLFFSSLNSFLKSAGQSNYVCGCVFKDAFARLLAQSWPCAVKVMNWGYWGSVGIVASDKYHKRMEQDGIGSIEPAEGMDALDVLLSGPFDQLALMKTTRLELGAELVADGVITAQPNDANSLRATALSANERHIQRIIADSGRARGFDDDLLCELLITQLQVLGMKTEGSGSLTELKGKLKPDSVYGRWLDESLRVLSDNGYLECSLDRYSVTHKAPRDGGAVWKRWETLCRDSKGANPYINILDQAIRECPRVLTGQKLATDVIFPNSSMSLVEGIYRRCDSADALNEIVADLVATSLETMLKREPSRRVRIFEIGSGTGGTSAKVLQKIKPHQSNLQEYCYTDLSKYFLLKGQKEFGAEHPYVQYKLFNVEQSPVAQGVGVGSYDIVLATNVLHATRDVRAAVRHAKSLLNANGMLILNELAANTLFSHLTFGLLEGWWLYRDPELRLEGCPGLSPAGWQTVLQEERFPSVSFPASKAHDFGHQIVVAQQTGGAARAESGALVRSAPQESARLVISGSAGPRAASDSEVKDHVQHTIVSQIQKSLSLDASEIHEDDAFVDYGVDSILGVQLIQDLNEALGVTLVTTDLFDYSSVRQLAAYVADTYPNESRASLARSRKESDVPPRAARDDRADDSAALESRVKEVIIAQIQKSLGLDRREIGEDDAFMDYGVDSILGVELIQDLNAALGITLVTTDLFDNSSVRALAHYVTANYRDALSSSFAELHRPVAEESAAPAQNVPTSAATFTPEPTPTPQKLEPFKKEESHREPIAIIGMSGKFGKAKDVRQLWEHLVNGDALVEEIKRWDLSKYHAPGASYCNYASLMDDVEQFDPMFFKISGLEATYMDPQQRMVLEESWKALEDAGYAGAAVQGQPCGVYIGTQISDYLTSPTEEAPPQAMWGNAESLIPARISYYLDLQGPAIAVDTACSGSLVAIHLACRALRAGEVKMALAGGVSVQCAPDYYLAAQKAGMLSPTGRCHTFDERADGFVPGEGVGVVVLKRLRDALADGDHIYGVVRGSGLNQDGTSNGITAPSAKSQERLERAVYDTFAINPADIQMVEAHGTGTKLGDPIEFHALSRAFRSYTDKKEFCAIGSIKTNIGHAAPASGVAGLIKILLALEHKKIPRSLHFQQGNAHIAFKDSPFYVNTVHRDWTVEPGRPRLAALSSFGFSGTNAHMVIEEAPQRERSAAQLPAHLVVLSAFSREQLCTQVSQLLAYLRKHPDVDLGDISLTLLLGRRHCHVRLACVAQNVHELTTHLQEWLSSGSETQVRVADLSEHAPRPQSSLEQYGNACLRQCAAGVEKTAYLEHLAAIRDLYLQGYELEYAQLFAAGTHKRLPLPTYPFQRQRYWLPETVQSQRPAPAASEVRALVERKESKDERDHMALAPFWSRDGFSEPAAVPSPKGNVVIIGGDASERAKIAAFCTAPHFLSITSAQSVDAITATLRRIGAIQSLIWIAPVDGSVQSAALLQRTDAGVVALFKLLKALFALGYGSEDLNWTVVTRRAQPVLQGEPVNPAEASVLGLVGVVAKEYPNWSVRSLDIGVDQDLPVHALFSAPSQAIRALRNGQWFRQVLAKVTLPAQTQSLYRKAGVYVVLGGAGGIGELWSEDVIRRFQAQVVWIGRREKDSAIQQKIDRLGALGRPPLYVSADASNLDALRVAYAQIKQRFGTINGVVQSAFGVVDRSLPNTSEEQFRQGLKSKIDASVCMAEVFGAEPLDFMLFFSSIASFSQTMGYCSYVAGNAFEDAFAHRLASELSYPVKVVNWGYWGAVGSGLDVPQHVRERIYQYGFGDIDPALAMDAVEKLLAAPLKQLAYLNTRKPEQFESFVSHESIRVLSPAARAADALTPQLPSRKQALLTVQTQVQSKLRELDALLAKLLWCELQSHGWFKERTFDVASFKQKNGVIGKYDRWLQECMKLFAQQGYLVKTGFKFLVNTASVLDRNEIASEWERSKREWLANPDLKASVILVDRTLQELTDILSGKIPAVDIIFPNSSLEYVEGIYKRNMIADYFNDIVGDCTVAWVERWLAQNADAKIRILEVGAGTGGTAATVLSRLQPYGRHIGEYCYTDLSRAFLIHGTQQFGAANPFLSCKIFDASKPLAAQGLEEGTYDLIIATNVLHATKDIRESLRNSKALLKPGGVIVVNEIVGNTVFGLLTFALLDGWWLYDDAELRTVGGPGLEPRMWKSVLEWEGFTSVEFPAADAHVLNQQIVVAVSDGVSRQAHGDVLPRVATQEPKAQAHKQPEVQGHTQRVAQPENAQPARVDGATLKENVRAYLKKMLAQTLMIPIGSIDVRAPLSTYGIDSILILQLTNILKNELGQVSSTLFFEYRTIEALADYFVAHQSEAIARLVNPVEDAPRAPPAVAVAELVESRQSVAADFSMKAAEPRHVRQESEETPRARTRDIAIIGMSARFPQADTMDAYWENLRSGKNCITEIPSDRWALDAFYEPDKERAIANGKSYSKWGGFVQGFAEFDPLFFEISPNEAMEIDPQERLFLQETWKAFEDAGYTRARLEKECDGQVGVFVGVTRAGFNLYGPELWRNGDTSYPFTSFGSVANRISFKMNLNGPSMPIDTMCSSSLTALHEACEHLLRGDCSMAVTGGVNLYLHPSSYINLCNLQMLSDEGKCRSFGRGGNGFVPGEGVGVLILKRLEDAERDNDHIYAVIRGTSINHGGTTNGYTVPNPVAQGKVIRKALDKSGVDARTISYVEAHGTGTALGDPVEINGLTRAFSSDTQDLQYCAIGSCKSNIGHAEAAAGIAGVCKVVLQMRHGQLAPSLHAEALNPHIDFATTPFVVQQELTEWKRPVISTGGVAREVPRRAGVSSFGAGGANAHVVIEEYIPKKSAPARVEAHEPAVVVLSAKNEERLREQVKGLLDGLRNGEHREVSIVDIAHTLQVGREAMSERLGMVVGSVDELKDKLQGFLERPEQTEGLYRGRVKRNSQALSMLTTDEDMSQVLEVWIAKGKYGKVLEFWVNGLELDWRMLHPGRKASVVSLPTYPFARERYWIAEKETIRPEVEDETESTDNKDSQSLIDKVLDGYLSDELNMETTAEKIRLTFNAGSRRGNG